MQLQHSSALRERVVLHLFTPLQAQRDESKMKGYKDRLQPKDYMGIFAPVAVAKRQKNVLLWLSFDHFENEISRI